MAATRVPSADGDSPSSSTPTAVTPGSKAKRRRSTANTECCRTCRLRKVKCAGNPGDGACTNCTRLELSCSFVQGAGTTSQTPTKISRTIPSRSFTEAGTLRKRAQRACRQCHTHKTKCSGDLPKCKRCEGVGLVCEYIPTKRKFSNVPLQEESVIEEGGAVDSIVVREEEKTTSLRMTVSQSPGPIWPVAPTQSNLSVAEDTLFRKDLVAKHLDVYFQHYFPIPCYGFLHPPTIYRDLEDGNLSEALSAGICALTSRLCTESHCNDDFRARCIDIVDFHIFRNMEAILRVNSRENLVVLVLAVCYSWMEGLWNKVWMYLALAARVVTALQMNWDEPGLSPKQESSRRLVWMIWLLDRFLAGGFEDHLVLRDDVMNLRLPCSNEAFRNATGSYIDATGRDSGDIQRPVELSMYACHIKLSRIRHQILAVTKRFAVPPTPHPRRPRVEASQVMESVTSLQAQLTNFNEKLPAHFKFSESNIHNNFNTPERPAFIMLFTWYFQLHIDLYRFSVPGLREEASFELARQLPNGFLLKSQKQAIGYAVTLAQFWENVQLLVSHRAPGLDRLVTADHHLAICIIQSTKVLLAARQHHLYTDLQEHSTAPLNRTRIIDEATLSTLIQSNLGMLEPISAHLPRIHTLAQDLKTAVANFQNNSQYDRPQLIGMPGVKPPENVRLPGPHYVLENALVEEIGSEESERRKTASIADRWFQHKALPERQRFEVGSDKKLTYDLGRPELPFFLAEARGCSAVSQPDQATEDEYRATTSPPLESGSFLSQATSYGLMPLTPLAPQQGFSSLSIDTSIGSHFMTGVASQQHAPGDLQQGAFLSPHPQQYTDTGRSPHFPLPTRSYSYGNSQI